MESGNIEQKESIEFRISNQLFWEILKMKIRSISLEYSSIRAKTIKEKRKALEKEILLLESKVNASGKAEDAKLLEEKNQELQNSRSKYVEGLILRSKATWYEMGEKIQNISVNWKKETLSIKPFLNSLTLMEIILQIKVLF